MNSSILSNAIYLINNNLSEDNYSQACLDLVALIREVKEKDNSLDLLRPLFVAAATGTGAKTIHDLHYERAFVSEKNLKRFNQGLVDLKLTEDFESSYGDIITESPEALLQEIQNFFQEMLGLEQTIENGVAFHRCSKVTQVEEDYYLGVKDGFVEKYFAEHNGNTLLGLSREGALRQGANKILKSSPDLTNELTPDNIIETTTAIQDNMLDLYALYDAQRDNSIINSALRKILILQLRDSLFEIIDSEEIKTLFHNNDINFFKLKGSSVMGYGDIRSPSDIDFEISNNSKEFTPTLQKITSIIIEKAVNKVGAAFTEMPASFLTDPGKLEHYEHLGRQRFYAEMTFKPEDVALYIQQPDKWQLSQRDITALQEFIGEGQEKNIVASFDGTGLNYPALIPSQTKEGSFLTTASKIDAVASKMRQITNREVIDTSFVKNLFDIYLMTAPKEDIAADTENNFFNQIYSHSKGEIWQDISDPAFRRALFLAYFEAPNIEPELYNLAFSTVDPAREESVQATLKSLIKLNDGGVINIPQNELNEQFAKRLLSHVWNMHVEMFGLQKHEVNGNIRYDITNLNEVEELLINSVVATRAGHFSRSQLDEYLAEIIYQLTDDIVEYDDRDAFAERLSSRIIKVLDYYNFKREGVRQQALDIAEFLGVQQHYGGDMPGFAIWVKSTGTDSHLKTANLLSTELQQYGIPVYIVTDTDAFIRSQKFDFGNANFVVMPTIPNKPEDGQVFSEKEQEQRDRIIKERSQIMKEAREKYNWGGFATELWPTAMSTHNESLTNFIKDAFDDDVSPMITYCIGRDIPGKNKTADAGELLDKYISRVLQGNDENLRHLSDDIPTAAPLEEAGRINYVGFYGAKPIHKRDIPEEEKIILVSGGASFKAGSQELYQSAIDMYQHLDDRLPTKKMLLLIDRDSAEAEYDEIVRYAIKAFEPGLNSQDIEDIIEESANAPYHRVELNKGNIIIQSLLPSKEYDELLSSASVIYTRGGMSAIEGAKSNIGIVGYPVKEEWEKHKKVEQEKRLEMLHNAVVGGAPLAEMVDADIVENNPEALADIIVKAYEGSQLRSQYLQGNQPEINFDGFKNAAAIIAEDLKALQKGEITRSNKPGQYIYMPRLAEKERKQAMEYA